jgi:hypothetical protein
VTIYSTNLRIDGNGEYDFHTANRLKLPHVRKSAIGKLCQYNGYVANNTETIRSGRTSFHGIYGVNGIRVDSFPRFDSSMLSPDHVERKKKLVEQYIEYQRERLQMEDS